MKKIVNVGMALLVSMGFASAVYASGGESYFVEGSGFQYTTTHTDLNLCGAAEEGGEVTAGPQSPRDIDSGAGTNTTLFRTANNTDKMSLCNIHYHWNAEHKSAAYSTAVDTENEHSGWAIVEPVSLDHEIREANDISHLLDLPPEYDPETGEEIKHLVGVMEGDTVEIHWVHTSCNVDYETLNPANGLGNCMTAVCANPQLRVVAQVFEVVEYGADVTSLEEPAHIHDDEVVEYIGSTTGPGFNNEHCSPFEVTWQVSKEVATIDAHALAHWSHEMGEHAHGVRALVTPEDLLSQIRTRGGDRH